MILPHILSTTQLILWFISFVLWIMSTYQRDYKVQLSDLPPSAKFIVYKRRMFFKSSAGFLYYSVAWTLFGIGAVLAIISGFIR